MASLLDRVPLPPAVVDLLRQTNLTNPLNIVLVVLAFYLLASLIPSAPDFPTAASLPTKPTEYNWRPESHPPATVWRSWRPEELRGYDGTRHDGEEQGKIMFAIRRKVYDVTSGRGFYGPGQSGPSRAPPLLPFRCVAGRASAFVLR